MLKMLHKYRRELNIMFGTILLVLVISTYFMNSQTNKTMVAEQMKKLRFLKSSLKVHIEDYFKTTQNVLSTLSSSDTTVNAIADLSAGFDKISSKDSFLIDKAARAYYMDTFLKQLDKGIPNALPKRLKSDYVPHSKGAQNLQENYIYKNPFDANKRYKLLDPKSGFFYDKSHKKYHPNFLRELQKYGFYDLFLIDMRGNVIYSVFKENDFATNLLKGVYKNSSLARIYKKAVQSEKNDVAFEDFKPYEPSYNKAAAFIATPVFKEGKKIAVLAIQLPVDELNKVMTMNNSQEEVGLGKSGESYLVGDDYYMRSDSRFTKQMNDPLVMRFATTVGIIKVDTTSVRQALNGSRSEGLIKDYRGIEVYSSSESVDVFDKKWVILAEIDKAEIDEMVEEAGFILMLTSFVVFIIFISLLLFLFTKLILLPMQKTEELLGDNLRLKNKALLTSETLLNEYKRAVDLSSIVSKADKRGMITYVNSEFCKISGFEKSELIGQPHNIVRHPDMPSKTFANLWDTLLDKKVWKGVIKNLKKDGGFYYVNSTIVPILDENKDISEFMSIRTDVTDLILKEEQILKQTVDALTSLPNRQKLMEDIEVSQDKMKLACISINNLREINDFYGEDIAQRIIKNTSDILQSLLVTKQAMELYKISGNEFALMTHEYMPMEDCIKVLQGIIEHFDYNVVVIEDNEFNISITVGIAGGERKRAFINAQMALRKTVEVSKSLIVFENSADIQEQYQKNIEMTSKIKNAIKNDDIILFAQPIVANALDGIEKFECLVRMRDGDKIISPFFFLETAKKARLYSTITKIVIEKSFAYFKNKKSEFSINLTLDDILNDELVSMLKRKIKDDGVGDKLVIELVESEGIEEYSAVYDFITSMKSLGCKIAIDDFGTGYSNFKYLMKLNADFIKIDGSLIKDIPTDTNSQVVVQLIVAFAKRMDIKVIAEYIHNEEVQQYVKNLDIDYSQGYHLGEPAELIMPV